MNSQKFIVSEGAYDNFSGDISIYYCEFSVTDFYDELFNSHHIHLPENIKRSVVNRRAEFFAGRYCAKQSMFDLDGTESHVHIGRDRNPLWPSHIVGSISHSNSHAVAVTALNSTIRGIGIDIQYLIDLETYSEIKTQIIFREEFDIIFNKDINLTEQILFTIIFSAKESFFKAAFSEVGRYFEFSTVSVVEIDYVRKNITFNVNEKLSGNLKEGVKVRAEYRMLNDNKIITLVRFY